MLRWVHQQPGLVSSRGGLGRLGAVVAYLTGHGRGARHRGGSTQVRVVPSRAARVHRRHRSGGGVVMWSWRRRRPPPWLRPRRFLLFLGCGRVGPSSSSSFCSHSSLSRAWLWRKGESLIGARVWCGGGRLGVL
jgi:hypothetical protein